MSMKLTGEADGIKDVIKGMKLSVVFEYPCVNDGTFEILEFDESPLLEEVGCGN